MKRIALKQKPSHQRPADVKGEWENTPENKRNIHQKVAAKTNGTLTVANLVSVTGAILTCRGIKQSSEALKSNDNKAVIKGVGKIAAGRACDLADGIIAKKFGVRGTVGAAVDSFLDKGLTLYAAWKLGQEEIVPKSTSNAIIAEQVVIVGENTAIQALGGEPNPSKSGKYSMLGAWCVIGGNIMSKGLSNARNNIAAGYMENTNRAAELATLGLGAIAVAEYGQRIADQLK